MGFGAVIATAISVVVLLAAGFALASGITQSASVTGAALNDASAQMLAQEHTSLAIDNLTGSRSEGHFTFSLSNVGTEKIDNISRIDVIVKFPGTDTALWVPYMSADAGTGYGWTCLNITSPVPGVGDAINPGMLDPGETMNILVQGAGSFPGNDVWVQAAAPDGVSATLEWPVGN